MVGASTHPGAGVPGVLMSAKALERWCRMSTALTSARRVA
jgi:phytoene dehydrogenase-like protein